jgi:parallel beta-helix repeat protein
MKGLSLAAVIVAIIAMWEVESPAQVTFYVAPTGNDENDGTKESPFATLEQARDAIRALKKKGALLAGGVTVWMRGGHYTISKTFELTAPDSGTEGASIIYRACEGEKARLIGGTKVAGFTRIDDPEVLSRIQEECRDKVLQADLRGQGITDFGEITSRGFGRPMRPAGLELFFQDKPMPLARWPNDSWARIAGVPAGKDGGRFTYEGDRPKRWLRSDDVWVHGYWTWDWAESYESVKAIDTEKREIATHEPHGVYGYSAGKRYYALNILEELDEPGEWYLDRKTGILYFWPPVPLDAAEAYVSMLEEPMVSLDNVSCVTLRDLTLEVTRGTAVEVVGGEHNLVAGCTLRNIGNAGVTIRGGKENGVVACDIYQTGDGGIRLEGGERRSLTPAGHVALNNHIYDFGRWVRTYCPAVAVAGVGNRVAHNLIHDAPHSAILLGGNEHTIEFNHIHHVCTETSDAGAFYMGRDFTERGNIVRYNLIHDLGEGSVQAIYLDDCASGTTVYGNICYKAGRGVLLGGGRDNTIENNIFVECNPAIHVDGRGLGWASFWFDGRDSTLMDRLKATNHKKPPYSTRYPELVTLLDDEPAVPKGNTIVRNIRLGGRWLDLLNGLTDRIIKIEDNLTEGDPGLVAPEKLDFRLKDDSPAFKMGFKRIPAEKIGLYRDEFRRTLIEGSAAVQEKNAFVHVSENGEGFAVDGKAWHPFGCNYFDPHTGWAPKLWQRFDAQKVESHFRTMRELGVNVVRVFLTAQSFYRDPPNLETDALEKFDEMLAIGRRYGIRLHPTGPDHWEGVPAWRRTDFIADAQALETQAAFWKAFAARYRDEPFIFAYDLLNEPQVRWNSPAMRSLWPQWLRGKYGTLDALREAWGEEGKAAQTFEEIGIPPDAASPGSRMLLDFQHFRETLADQWVRVQADAIRSADPNHPVTVGLIQWTVPANYGNPSRYAAFRPSRIAPMLDFLSIHFYPLYGGDPLASDENLARNLGYLELVLRYVKAGAPQKPLFVGEFGWHGGGKPDGLQERSAEDQVRWCEAAVLQGRGITAGWLNWAYADTPSARDATKFSGLVTEDGKAKPWGVAFSKLAADPAVWTARPPEPEAEMVFDVDQAIVDPKSGDAFLKRYCEAWKRHKRCGLIVR